MPRAGKIGRLPIVIRDELNRRLINGETSRVILAWVNGLDEAKSVLAAEFNGDAINDQNLTNWRQGEYQTWLGRRESIQKTRELARFAMDLAQAKGGSIAEGGAAIAAGKLLEILEATDSQKLEAAEIGEIVTSLSNLRASEIAADRIRIEEEKLKRKDEELRQADRKFRRETCEMFVKWSNDARAKEILASGSDNAEKIQQLGQAMFGDLWEA
jgi:hypothetical protein